GIHHLGVAVVDLDEAVDTYVRLLGADLEHRSSLPEQGVEAAAVLVGGGRIELLAPSADDTPVGRFLAGRGPGLHHVALEVADGGATLGECAGGGAAISERAAAVPVLTAEEPRHGFFGLQVAFVHPDAVHGVLTEVVS